MPQPDLFVGIDVAKNELVIHLHPAGKGWRTSNDKAGLAALGRRLTALAGKYTLAIGFEATGGYERKLGILLDRLALPAYLLDPARVRHFAKAERQLAKSDPLDAAVIARCLAAIRPQLTPWRHDPHAARLAEHVRMRDLAVAQAVQCGNQLDSLDDPAMRRIVKAQVARLKALVLRIEKAMAGLIAAAPDLAARERLLRSAPGVGPIVAACLLARLPELGTLSSRQVAALAGIAPFDRQSGTSTKAGRCSGGRPAVRKALYLATLSIVRSKSGTLAATCKRLRDIGKPAKVAIVATMRKLLVTLNAMLKSGTPYQTA